MAPRIAWFALATASCAQESGAGADCGLALEVNEIAAANEHVDLADEAFCADTVGAWCCEEPDWFEIVNRGRDPAPIGGLRLSQSEGIAEGEPFPDVEIDQDELFLVIAVPFVELGVCDEPGALPGRFVHGGIDLNRDGDLIALIDAGGRRCLVRSYPDQHADISWGRLPDGDGPFEYMIPSPWERNERWAGVY